MFSLSATTAPFSFFQRKRHKQLLDKRQKRCASQGVKPYQCVEVVPASNILDSRDLCEAYHGQKGKRYLSMRAPSLPLAGCDKQSCKCRYKTYSDRRDDDRRSAFGMHNSVNTLQESSDRRSYADRRKKLS